MASEQRNKLLGIIKTGHRSAREILYVHILLRSAQGWTDAQIAEAFDISCDTVLCARRSRHAGALGSHPPVGGGGSLSLCPQPMISGVTLMLLGQALFWGSWLTAAWASLFVMINHIYFVLSEEPGLESRFGEPYRIYKTNVPHWLPRLKPWSGK
jgi:hypothetical protein